MMTTLPTASTPHATPQRRKLLALLWRAWAVRVLGLATLVLMSLAAAGFPPGDPDPDVMAEGALLGLAGAVPLLLALWLCGPLFRHERHTPPLKRAKWVLSGLGLLCVLALTESSAQLAGIEALHNLSHHRQFQLLAAAAVLLVWGMGGGGLPHDVLRLVNRLRPDHLREIVLVLGVTLLGGGLRLFRLTSGMNFFLDELNFAEIVPYFRGVDSINILSPFVRGFPATYSYLQFLSTEAFGPELTGLRLLSVLFGTLTIPAVYFLARFMFDRSTATVAILLIATFPPHIHFSRIGLNNIADPLFGTVALAFLAGGMRYNVRLSFALAGVSLGLTQYWYEVGRIFYPLLVALWCGWGLLTGYARPYWRGLVLAGGLAVVLATPIYATYYAEDVSIIPRVTNQAGVYETSEVSSVLDRVGFNDDYLRGLSQTTRVYINQTEGIFPYYGGYYGYVLLPLLPLLFIGVATVLARPQRMPIVLVLNLALLSFATSLIAKNVIAARFVMTFPALTVLVALGLRMTVAMLVAAQQNARLQRVALRGVAVLGVLVALFQGLYYHQMHLHIFNAQFRGGFTYDGHDVAMRAAELEPPQHIQLLTINTVDVYALQGILDYLQPDNLGITVWKHDVFSVWHLPPGDNHVFFVPWRDAETAGLLHYNFVLSTPAASPSAEWIPDRSETALYRLIARRQGPFAPLPAVDEYREYVPFGVLRGGWCAFDRFTWDLGRHVCFDPWRARGVFGAQAWAASQAAAPDNDP